MIEALQNLLQLIHEGGRVRLVHEPRRDGHLVRHPGAIRSFQDMRGNQLVDGGRDLLERLRRRENNRRSEGRVGQRPNVGGDEPHGVRAGRGVRV